MNEDRIIDIFIILCIIAVIVLKIMNVITISWLWLLCPLWGLVGLGIVFCVFIAIVYLMRNVFRKIKGEKE